LPTPSMEDHIEIIYSLIEQKGYARVSDIAEALSVLPSSVTKMVQKLDKDGYLIYERYRGLVLTPQGQRLGGGPGKRHDVREQLQRLNGLDEEPIYDDAEGIEGRFRWTSIHRLAELVQVREDTPEVSGKLERPKKGEKNR